MRWLVWPIKYDYMVASDDLAVICYNNVTLNSDEECITTFLICMHSIWIFYFFTLLGPYLQETFLALVRQISRNTFALLMIISYLWTKGWDLFRANIILDPWDILMESIWLPRYIIFLIHVDLTFLCWFTTFLSCLLIYFFSHS